MENDLFMETVLDSEAIKKLLPHRYPFLFVDRIIELKPLERIVGIKQVSINESFFQGHFPGAPVMPGVVVIEALAQCGAILVPRPVVLACAFDVTEESPRQAPLRQRLIVRQA